MALALLYISQHVSDVGDVVSECRLNHYCGGSAYTRIPHHQQTIPLHNISTPQVSLHNTTSIR